MGDTYGDAIIKNCYSAAAITNTLTSATNTSTSTSGLVGDFANSSEVINSVALNPSIKTSISGPGRIVGTGYSKGIVTNSYAASEMVISKANDIGITLPTAQILTVDFWITTVGWDDDICFFENGVLPVFSTTHTVSFAGEDIDTESQDVKKGNPAKQLKTPEREGYDFGGWFTDNSTFLNKWNFQIDAVMQDTTLYAKWSIKTYLVTFAGEAINGITPRSVEHGRL
ncbi:MAG: InlB B-repeat-containing protein, partial [Dysgonamonadaceae bacterium]|nr:InlB B-repeat-containing protein [Dysgonamonadaceae bacterium]